MSDIPPSDPKGSGGFFLSDDPIPTLWVCTHQRMGATGSCGAGGGITLLAALRTAVAARGLPWRVAESRCMGQCRHGPNIKAAPGGPLLTHCRARQADKLIAQLLKDWQTNRQETAQDPP